MLILASQSPRRRKILDMLGYMFECRPAHADETVPAGMAPGEAVELLAARKARAVGLSAGAGDTVLGSDTVVALDGAVLGKPSDRDDALRMLRALSGRTHTVYTGVALLKGEEEIVFHDRAEVTFYPLEEAEIAAYAATGEPMDKAGAYGIQGRGSALVEGIRGDFFTVMGLPAGKTVRALRRMDVWPAAQGSDAGAPPGLPKKFTK